MKKLLLLLSFVVLTSFSENLKVNPEKSQKNPKNFIFYIVAKDGFILNADHHNSFTYFCQTKDTSYRSIYRISLPIGNYRYVNLDKSDTISFVVDKSGVYKLGFYEDHKSFDVLKYSPFSMQQWEDVL